MFALLNRLETHLARFPEGVLLLFVRIAAAQVFWFSGRSKVEGWFTFRSDVVDLFRDEYRLPLITPELAAPLSAVAEHVLPLLLVLGLFSRFAALGLLVMTLVIQLFVYPDAWWTQHFLWMGLLLVVVVRGGGGISLDRYRMQPTL